MLKELLKSELVKNSILVSFATLAGSFVAFLANIYLASSLGPENFGIFKVIISLFTFLPVILSLGIQSVFPKYIAEYSVKAKNKIGYLIFWFLRVRIVLFLIAGILVFLFRNQLSLFFLHSESYGNLIGIGLILLIAYFFSMFTLVLQGVQRFRFFSFIQFLSLTLPAIAAILLSGYGLTYVLLGWSTALLFVFLIPFTSLFREKFFRIQHRYNMKEIIFKFALPLYFLSLIISLSTVTVTFLSIFFSAQLIGFYSFAVIFYTGSLIIPNAIASVLLPKTSELFALKQSTIARNTLKKALVLYTPIAIVGTLFVFFLGETLISLISKQYLQSLILFQNLVTFGLFSGYIIILSYYYQGRGMIKETIGLILIQTILLFSISYFLLRLM